jgi:hypothetical protein
MGTAKCDGSTVTRADADGGTAAARPGSRAGGGVVTSGATIACCARPSTRACTRSASRSGCDVPISSTAWRQTQRTAACVSSRTSRRSGSTSARDAKASHTSISARRSASRGRNWCSRLAAVASGSACGRSAASRCVTRCTTRSMAKCSSWPWLSKPPRIHPCGDDAADQRTDADRGEDRAPGVRAAEVAVGDHGTERAPRGPHHVAQREVDDERPDPASRAEGDPPVTQVAEE